MNKKILSIVIILYSILYAGCASFGKQDDLNHGLRGAVLDGNLEGAIYFIKNGAEVNFRCHIMIRRSTSTISSAVLGGNIKIFRLLFEHGADVNFQDYDGDTALHEAVKRKKINIIIYLVKNGANIFLKNKNDVSPYDMADKKLKKLLLKTSK